jgi:hypothetical protein
MSNFLNMFKPGGGKGLGSNVPVAVIPRARNEQKNAKQPMPTGSTGSSEVIHLRKLLAEKQEELDRSRYHLSCVQHQLEVNENRCAGLLRDLETSENACRRLLHESQQSFNVAIASARREAAVKDEKDVLAKQVADLEYTAAAVTDLSALSTHSSFPSLASIIERYQGLFMRRFDVAEWVESILPEGTTISEMYLQAITCDLFQNCYWQASAALDRVMTTVASNLSVRELPELLKNAIITHLRNQHCGNGDGDGRGHYLDLHAYIAAVVEGALGYPYCAAYRAAICDQVKVALAESKGKHKDEDKDKKAETKSPNPMVAFAASAMLLAWEMLLSQPRLFISSAKIGGAWAGEWETPKTNKFLSKEQVVMIYPPLVQSTTSKRVTVAVKGVYMMAISS